MNSLHFWKLTLLIILVHFYFNGQAYNMANTTITTCSGNFYDSNGSASNYSSNENYVMTINPGTAGQFVNVAFSSFSTESNTDFLYIYDGGSTSSPLIGMYSGSTSPNSITARNSGGSLTFKFTSNGNTQATGWAAVISCSATAGSSTGVYLMTNNAVDTVCGGSFYDSGGSGSNYAANESKVMTFYPATAGQFMTLYFSAFLTQFDADLLYIYDGSSTSAPLIATYSGSTSPDTITARNSAGCITVKFYSNGNTQSAGWAATLGCSAIRGSSTGTYPMTNLAVDTVCGGRFYGSGGTVNGYSSNESSIMTLYPASTGQYLNLTFSSFQTELNTDLLYIYDGSSTSSSLIGIYSGPTSPVCIGATNASGCLTIKFTSNGSNQSAGWVATLSCSATPGSSSGVFPITDGASITTCSGTIYDTGGSGGNYSSGESNTMTLNPSSAGQYITLTFSSFATEVNSDFFYIYDGPNTSSSLIGIYSGTTSPNVIGAHNAAGCLTIKFTSNGGSQTTGWAATISCSATAGSSGGVYPITNNAIVYACSGTFYDEGGPGNNYFPSENDTMTIYPSTSGQYLQVDFSAFLTRVNDDYLSIYDGSSTSAPLIATYSGSASPVTITARNPAGCLTFVFYSNAIQHDAGWAATLSCSATRGTTAGVYPMTNNAVNTVCGGTFYDSGGSANDYNASETKTMTFYPATTGQYLYASFSSFSTDGGNDLLYIYDGASTSAPVIGIFSESTSPCNVTAANSTGALTFKFTSNGSVQDPGWVATFSCVSSSCSNSGCYPMSNNAVIHTCSGTFTDSGVNAGDYGGSENSTMTFYPTSGEFVQLAFSSFSTQSGSDILYLYDGPNVSSTLIGSYSGTTSPGTVTATNSAGCITAKFTSNGSVQNIGWTAAVSCTGGGALCTWAGATSTSWTDVSNWSNVCSAPACNSNVIIPVASHIPVITASTSAKNLTINSGATLQLNAGVSFSICGDLTNNGTITLAPSSTLVFNNGSVVQNINGSISGSNSVGNIIVTKTGGSVILNCNLDVAGNLTTTNSTSIFNLNGKYLKLGGNFNNASGSTTFTNTSGSTVEFNGTGSQTYTPGGSVTLNNVLINKTSGNVTLSGNDMTIGTSGTLTLTSGKIITGSYKVVSNNTASSSVTAGNASSYVEGTLQRYISGAAASYNFPVGNSTKGFHRANINFTTATSIPNLTASFNNWPSAPTGPSVTDCNGEYYGSMPMLDNGYWQITASSNPTSGNYNLSLYNNNYSSSPTTAYWTVASASTIASSWGLSGNCNNASTAGISLRNNMNGFGVFGTGQAPMFSPLPVALLSFTGKSYENKNVISWKVATISSTGFFKIEKSNDGLIFTEAGSIPVTQNNSVSSYEFTDVAPFKPVTYYRLKQTDNNGHYDYSGVISVSLKNEIQVIEIYPNPTHGQFTLTFNQVKLGPVTLQLINDFGKVIYTQKLISNKGLQQTIFPGALNAGLYLVRITDEAEEIYNQKLLVY